MEDKEEFSCEYVFELKVRIADSGGSSEHNAREAVKEVLCRAIAAYGDIDTNDWAWHLKNVELE